MRHPNAAVDKAGQPMMAVREDGLLVPYRGDAVRKDPKLRPWWGDPNATPEEVRAYLNGTYATPSAAVARAKDEGRIDVETASKEDLIDFAVNEFGVTLPENVDVTQLRSRVKMLLNNPPAQAVEAKPQAMKIPKFSKA